MKPAWKVALQVLAALVIVTLVIGGVAGASHHGDAGSAGHQVGETMAPVILIGPAVAYIIQKTRIDARNRKDKGPG